MIIKFYYTLLSIVCVNSFSLSKPSIKNKNLNIKMITPNYDPNTLINSVARSSESLDKWNINEFVSEVSKKHIDSVSLLKNPLTENINAVVAIDNDYSNGLPDIRNLHYIETGIQKINDIIIDSLIKNDVYYGILQLPPQDQNMAGNIINFVFNGIMLYFILTLGLGLIQRFGSGGGMSQGKMEDKTVIDSKDISTKFDDVAGCDEPKYELQEIVEFLKNPLRYQTAGAKVPKGVLLEGPPGTGKTLLARAVAGEAGVSFIQVSGSEFIQMFVGVGASRVRDLFKKARENSPCVVFIDEIDAVGRKRGEQFSGGGNEEREQTLNQILTNMDGFEKTDSIIVLAATNRVDILDSALTRSGRFDRKVRVGLPDVTGRRKIIDVHLRDKFVEESTDLDELAALTTGFSGADIENMANEAVILALRQNKTTINSTNLVDAFEKITIGLPLLSKETKLDEERLVSYHEAGHTLTALLFKEFFDVRKVTITANTNGAGGYTLFTPKDNINSYPSKKYLLANLIVTMGGRAAEIVLFNKILKNSKTGGSELDDIYNGLTYNQSKVFDTIRDLDITAGASSDLRQADKQARQFVQLFGIEYDKSYSKTIQPSESPYSDLSETTKTEVDNFVNRLVVYSLNKAIRIIENNMDAFNKLAEDLIEKKSVDLKYLETLDVNYY